MDKLSPYGNTTSFLKLRQKSKWKPSHGSPNFETFININEIDLNNEKIEINRRQNITESERMAIKELAKNYEITIKQADIGRAIVIMNTADYVKEAERQLSDEKTYKKLQDNPTNNYPYEINNINDDMVINGDINKNVAKILRNNETRTPQMYFLPQIHKGTLPPPGRPIVSANGCPTEKISAFVDHFLNPMVKEMNSYVEDTSDFLRQNKWTKNH